MISYSSNTTREHRQVRGNILLAEDDGEMRAMLAQALRSEGHVITECPDGVQLLVQLTPLLDHIGHIDYDLIVSDIRMPGLTSMEILQGLAGCEDLPPVVLITAFGDRATHDEARRYGVAAMLDKPFDIDWFVAVVNRALRRQ